MDFYALKLCAASKNLLENVHLRILDIWDIQWPRNEYEQGQGVGGVIMNGIALQIYCRVVITVENIVSPPP